MARANSAIGLIRCFAVFGVLFKADGKHVFCSANTAPGEFQRADVRMLNGDDVPAPNSPSMFSDRHRTLSTYTAVVAAALMRQSVFLGAELVTRGKLTLPSRNAEVTFSPRHFSPNTVKRVGRGRVGDPHILSVEEVDCICAEIRPGTHGERSERPAVSGAREAGNRSNRTPFANWEISALFVLRCLKKRTGSGLRCPVWEECRTRKKRPRHLFEILGGKRHH